jgi:histidinol-phosphate phosphatase family protein
LLAQAVILVGGLGTRLGELTARTPKPLLPIAGRPFLEHLIQEVSRYGFQRVTLLAGRFGDLVRDSFDGRILSGMAVDVLVEPTAMGTGGALAHAAAQDRLDPVFLLMNGDSWIDMNLAGVVRNWEAAASAFPELRVQLLLKTVPDAARYGTVAISDGKITAFREKSPDSANRPGQINAGVYVIDRRVVADISADRPSSLEGDILPALVARGCVTGIPAPREAYFIDIGLPETYREAGKDLMHQRTRPALFLDRDGTLNQDRGYTHRPDDLVWQPDAQAAIKYANDAGYYVFVVTNQAGVARGFYGEDDVVAFHRAMQTALFDIEAHVDAFEWCPHHVEGTVEAYSKACRRRKPQPGMIEDLIAQWPVDVARSLLIGDSADDMRAAEAAGIAGVRYDGGSLLELVRRHIG